jgi:tetratricopeptide (TPR) repeat protein
MSVYNAMKDDRFLPIAELDEGFIRPTYEAQIIVSYMQAGLICHFIDTQYGSDKLSELLYQFGDGLLTAEAIEVVIGIPARQFDKEFDKYVQSEHGAILDNLEDWHRTQQSVSQHIAAGEWRNVPALARHLISLLPQYTEPDSPYIALARAEQELGNSAAAMDALEAFWRHGGYEPDALQRLASWFNDAGRTNDAVDVLTSINFVEPLDQELHGTLGDMLLAEGRPIEALQEFTVALALDPHDKATAYYRMAQAYYDLGNRESSQDNLLQALDVAPNFRPAQRLLLEVARTDPVN